jgi:hypothetical protein
MYTNRLNTLLLETRRMVRSKFNLLLSGISCYPLPFDAELTCLTRHSPGRFQEDSIIRELRISYVRYDTVQLDFDSEDYYLGGDLWC